MPAARITGVALFAAGLLACPGLAQAQRTRSAGPPRFDVTVGGGVVTGTSLGTSDANLRVNATTLQDYRLFSTTTTLRPAPIVDVRVGGVVTGRLDVEGQLLVGRSTLETAVSNDVEAAPDVTVSERLTQLLVGGGVRIRLDNVARAGRTRPYVSAGAGMLRQTHEDGVSREQSPVFYVGGGVRHLLGSRSPRPARAGLRADVQVLMVKGGLSVDDSVTPQVSATGGVFFSF